MHSARAITYREMGIRWPYWLSALGFVVAGGAALIIGFTTNDPAEDKKLIVGCGVFFATIGSLFTSWPILRVREKGEVKFRTMMSGGRRYAGLLVPVSKVKQQLMFVGMLVMGGGALWLMINSDSDGNRAKAAIGSLLYLGFLVVFIVNGVRKRPGILLTEEGVLWHEFFQGGCFVEWGNIASLGAFQKQEQYGKTPALGVLVHDATIISKSKMRVQSAVQNAKRQGFHLDYEAESLLWPLELVEEVIGFYWKNSAMRHELGTGAAVDRVARGIQVEIVR